MAKILDKTIGLRVSDEEEEEGLDYMEHGEIPYTQLANAIHEEGLINPDHHHHDDHK